MPHSIFTRFLAALIVVYMGVLLFWPPDREAFAIASFGIMAVPVMLGLLAWNMVRDAPPFEANAFYRTLPVTSGTVFFRTLRLPLLMLAGVCLLIVLYCWHYHFGWRLLSYSLLSAVLVGWGIIAACGVAASLATAWGSWRIAAWVLVLATPALAALGVDHLRQGLDPEAPGEVFFTRYRTIALSAAILYTLIWWLIAVGRKRNWGLALAIYYGALIPGLFAYGDLGPDRNANLRPLTRLEQVVYARPLIVDGSSTNVSRTRIAQPKHPWNTYLETVPASQVPETQFLKPEIQREIDDHYEAPVTFEVGTGGRAAVSGGTLELAPLGPDFTLRLYRYCDQFSWQVGPWMEELHWPLQIQDSLIYLLDEAHGEAYLLSNTNSRIESLPLGCRELLSFQLYPSKARDFPAMQERIRHWKIVVRCPKPLAIKRGTVK